MNPKKDLRPKNQIAMGRWLAGMLSLALVVCLHSGCASAEKQVQQAAKDWCMTIRGSQVIPVYPLTEDLQPGDVFLVQIPIDKQQALYKAKGFLALDNLIARIHPDGYNLFYGHSFLNASATNVLPLNWIRPDGVGLYAGTNGTNTRSWQAAPRVTFPSYSFSVQNGAGMSLAVPVSGVPVALSLLASDAASGTIQIEDARTMGVDTISLYNQLKCWAETNQEFLNNFGPSPAQKKTNFVRVVTRVYASGKMLVTLKDASNRSAGLDGGVPKPVNLLTPQLPSGGTNTQGAALQNYTNAWSALSEIIKGAGALTNAAGRVLPGGSLRLAAASARSVSLDETLDPPVILGYLGFDCAIYDGGALGPPIPTQAVLDSKLAYEFAQFKAGFVDQTSLFNFVKKAYDTANADRQAAIRAKAVELQLIDASVPAAPFLKELRRKVDPNDRSVGQKFKALAAFCQPTS
jgi:hypothetical protein